ncbi:hypothetical protein K505DRAFT_418962 [Melanomma pulvis-pyrius CBS 109.77]|uniref:Uncharacterized protein n=1 Tax=Melanomma pulvis-pyrius CBS 109.77 TaxID=1314802 RepID=A0A6A6X5S1_9PLEO|nr:hypothetical protein K505DRAFT_418962 [Melanomma pulvis-pyrius CBS 109.77]
MPYLAESQRSAGEAKQGGNETTGRDKTQARSRGNLCTAAGTQPPNSASSLSSARSLVAKPQLANTAKFQTSHTLTPSTRTRTRPHHVNHPAIAASHRPPLPPKAPSETQAALHAPPDRSAERGAGPQGRRGEGARRTPHPSDQIA